MISIAKIVGVVSCGFVLCLGLPDADAAHPQAETSASDDRGSQGNQDLIKGESDPTVIQSEEPTGEVIKGEVLRVDGEYLVVKGKNGKEVRMHIDQSTRMSDKTLGQGELIEATVNEQNHALSIHSTDRRSDHTLESGPAMS
jgi:hypothetical protein